MADLNLDNKITLDYINIRRELEILLSAVKGVTDYHIHGNPVPTRRLDKLVDAQLRIEIVLNKLKNKKEDGKLEKQVKENCNIINEILKIYNLKYRDGILISFGCSTCRQRDTCDRQIDNGYLGCRDWI